MPIFEVLRDTTRDGEAGYPILENNWLAVGKLQINKHGLLVPMHIEKLDAVRIFLSKVCGDKERGWLYRFGDGMSFSSISDMVNELRLNAPFDRTLLSLCDPELRTTWSIERHLGSFINQTL